MFGHTRKLRKKTNKPVLCEIVEVEKCAGLNKGYLKW